MFNFGLLVCASIASVILAHPHPDDGDQCILLIGGLPNEHTVEYYHPIEGVDCDVDDVGRMATDRTKDTDWTSGCYLASSRQVVTRESDNPFKPPMLYDLKDESAQSLPLPFRTSDSRTFHTPYTSAAAVGPSKCFSCGGAYFEDGWNHVLECYQFDANNASSGWTPIVPMPDGVAHATATTLDNRHYYFIGGLDDKGTRNNMCHYDAQTHKWNQEAAMPEGRFWHSATALSATELMVCGGVGKRADCVVYSRVFNKWRTVGSLNSGREQFAMVSFNDGVYAIGGDGSDGKLASVEKFDRASETWKVMKAIQRPRSHFVAVVVKKQ